MHSSPKVFPIKRFFILPIRGYQYISKMLPANCRYYPTCSEYAAWHFAFNAPHKAMASSALRILRCNQLFEGGIDYPLVKMVFKKPSYLWLSNSNYGKIKVIYWFVPALPSEENKRETTHYYVLKDFDAIDT